MKQELQWKLADNKKRKLLIKYELKTKIFKSFIKSTDLALILNYFCLFKRTVVKKKKLISQLNNRCLISGRNKNIIQKLKYSRFQLRNEAYKGNIPTIKKRSW